MSLLPSAKKTRPGTEISDRQDSEKLMNSATKQISVKWAALLSKLNADEVSVRYEIGCDLKDISDNKNGKYQDNSTELLLNVHGDSHPAKPDLNRHNWRDYVSVARNFNKEEVDEIKEWNSSAAGLDRPVSWTHLVLLSAVSRSDAEFRKNILAKICTEGLSCKTVRDLVQAYINKNPSRSTRSSKSGIRPTNTFKKAGKHSSELTAVLDEVVDSSFIGRLETIKPADIDKTLEHVNTAIDTATTLYDGLPSRLEILENARKYLQARRKQGKESPSPKVVAAKKVTQKTTQKATQKVPESVPTIQKRKVKVLRKKKRGST